MAVSTEEECTLKQMEKTLKNMWNFICSDLSKSAVHQSVHVMRITKALIRTRKRLDKLERGRQYDFFE